MDKLFGFISGYRTYITAVLILINHIGIIAGFWTWDQAAVIDSILAPFGLMFLRAAVTDKAGKTGPN